MSDKGNNVLDKMCEHHLKLAIFILYSRHRCPHNPRGLPRGNAPCTFSEYSNKYVTHPLEMVKSCKPEVKPVAGQGPLDDETTHRYFHCINQSTVIIY